MCNEISLPKQTGVRGLWCLLRGTMLELMVWKPWVWDSMTETTICIHSQNFPKLLRARSDAQIHSLGCYSTHTAEQGMGLNGGLGTVPSRGFQGGTALVSGGFPGPLYMPQGTCNSSCVYLALESLQSSIRSHESIFLDKDCSRRCLAPQVNP